MANVTRKDTKSSPSAGYEHKNIEAALMKRLCQIVGTTEMNVSSFKENDKPFLEIIKAVYGLPIINGTKEGVTRKKEQLDNVKAALKFLQRVKVDTKSIKPVHIYEGHHCLLQLLLTLLKHYIEKKLGHQSTPDGNTVKMFCAWINDRLQPAWKVSNLTTDWRTGMALGALIDSFVPGACSDWRSFKASEKEDNIRRVMEIAEVTLGVEKIIDSQCMTHGSIDETIMLIYLSQFLELSVPADKGISPACSSPEETAVTSRPTVSLPADKGIPPACSSPEKTAVTSCPTITTTAHTTTDYITRNSARLIRYKPKQSITEFWAEMDRQRIKYKPQVKQMMKDIDMTRGKLLGKGHREVWRVRYVDLNEGFKMATAKFPAMKSLKSIQDFLDEAYFINSCNHRNVIPLVELTFHEGLPCMILPLYKKGNLHAYLNENQNTSKDMLLMFATDITKGVKYIADRDYIYRNLQAKNCLVSDDGEDLTIVLSEFDLSRDVCSNDYEISKNSELQWKWSALEVLKYKSNYTKAADVWALGVVFYEVFSKGKTPYKDIHTPDDLIESLELGQRLEQPLNCPDSIYKVMESCWKKDPAERPSLETVLNKLETEKANTELMKPPI